MGEGISAATWHSRDGCVQVVHITSALQGSRENSGDELMKSQYCSRLKRSLFHIYSAPRRPRLQSVNGQLLHIQQKQTFEGSFSRLTSAQGELFMA